MMYAIQGILNLASASLGFQDLEIRRSLSHGAGGYSGGSRFMIGGADPTTRHWQTPRQCCFSLNLTDYFWQMNGISGFEFVNRCLLWLLQRLHNIFTLWHVLHL
jgi:hypothetical protein